MSSFIASFPTLNIIHRVLVCMDRIISAALGRPCAIHDDEYVCWICDCKSLPKIYFYSSFDLELPIDCDDEYWDHPDPKQRFKQPENKPSLISAFISFIKLNQILSYCLRTIVSLSFISRLLTDEYFAVCHQQVENFIRLCRSQLGATYCSRTRLVVKQMG